METSKTTASENANRFKAYNHVSRSVVLRGQIRRCNLIGGALPPLRGTTLALLERRAKIKQAINACCRGTKLRKKFWRQILMADRKHTFPLVA